MIDHDPLAGRDPYPRERLDLLPLHDARQELLEEIVSDPQSRTTSRVLVPAGIVAALAIVAGSVWFAVTGDENGGDDPVVAASSDATTDATASDPTSEVTGSTETTETAEPAPTPVAELREGDVLGPEQCRRARRDGRLGQIDEDGLRTRLSQLSYVVRLGRKDGDRRRVGIVRIVRAGDRLLGIDKDCTILVTGTTSGRWGELRLGDEE